jgi:AcrR family transcriptional regulator
MARPKNTPEKIERMRNSMMDAVISLLDEVSPEKVSIRMIAEKVGVSHMVFYTYFKDRDEIMRVLIDREKKGINDHFASKLAKAQTGTVKSVISELMREYVDIAQEHPKLFRLFWLDTSRRLDKESNRFNHLRESFSSLTKLLKIGMDKGEFVERPARLAAATVMAIINGPIVLHQCEKLPDDITCDELIEQILQAMFAYLES